MEEKKKRGRPRGEECIKCCYYLSTRARDILMAEAIVRGCKPKHVIEDLVALYLDSKLCPECGNFLGAPNGTDRLNGYVICHCGAMLGFNVNG